MAESEIKLLMSLKSVVVATPLAIAKVPPIETNRVESPEVCA